MNALVFTLMTSYVGVGCQFNLCNMKYCKSKFFFHEVPVYDHVWLLFGCRLYLHVCDHNETIHSCSLPRVSQGEVSQLHTHSYAHTYIKEHLVFFTADLMSPSPFLCEATAYHCVRSSYVSVMFLCEALNRSTVQNHLHLKYNKVYSAFTVLFFSLYFSIHAQAVNLMMIYDVEPHCFLLVS